MSLLLGSAVGCIMMSGELYSFVFFRLFILYSCRDNVRELVDFVPGAIYKGFSNQQEAERHYRLAQRRNWVKIIRNPGQYFTIPHAIHMDSTGFHCTSLYFTIYWTVSHIQYKTGLHWTPLDCQLYTETKLDSTRLPTLFNTKLDSTELSTIYQYRTGLHWTANHILIQNWTPLDCQPYSTQNWTPLDSQPYIDIKLDSTGLSVI